MNAVDVPVRETKGKGWMLWIGWVVSLWPAFVVVSSATWKLTRNQWYVTEFARIGWPDSALPLLAFLQLGSLLLFLIPRTSVLGAILLTGLMGGTAAIHWRHGDPWPSHILFGVYLAVFAWGGLWLRDARLRALMPLRAPLA